VRIRGLGIWTFGCNGGEATFSAKSPGHVSSGNTAPLSVRTGIDAYKHHPGRNTLASCHDATTATGNHDDNGNDNGNDNSVAARW
jgi:hypothetical protein